MKNILTLLILVLLIGCTPVRYVNVQKKHNYYKRHRATTYTTPIWIPGTGIVLETRIYRLPKRSYAPLSSRRKH